MSMNDKISTAGAKPVADKIADASPLAAIKSGLFDDVEVAVTVHIGETAMTIAELCALKAGSVVKLDLRLNEPAILRLKDKVIARGEIVAVDENFGLRITEIAPLEQA